MNLPKTICSESKKADVVLVDCLTLYVANVVGAKKGLNGEPNAHIEDVCNAIRTSQASVIADGSTRWEAGSFLRIEADGCTAISWGR